MAYLQEQPDTSSEERHEAVERATVAREEWTRRAIRDGVSQTEELADDLRNLGKRSPRTKTVAAWTAWRINVELDGGPGPRDLDLAQLVRWAVTARDPQQSDVARQLAKSNIVAHVLKVVDETITEEADEHASNEVAS